MGKAYYLCPPSEAQGIVAEWLGSALQKLLQRFESARYLKKSRQFNLRDFYFERNAENFVFIFSVR